MQGLLLLVFSKLKHVPFIRDIQATYTRTGIFRYWVSSGWFLNLQPSERLNSFSVVLTLLAVVFVSQGNKGGLSVRLSFYGHTVCFLNCHLAAHMQYASERVDEFEYIVDTQTFDCKKTPKVIDHRWGDERHAAARTLSNLLLPSRLLFWFGDLNFRIQDHGIHFVRSCISSQNYSLLWSKDQVTPPPLHL